jgi:hypothetical protein
MCITAKDVFILNKGVFDGKEGRCRYKEWGETCLARNYDEDRSGRQDEDFFAI